MTRANLTKIALLFISFAVYFLSWRIVDSLQLNKLSIQSEDTVPAMFVPLAIIRDHTLYLDKYYKQMVTTYPNPDDKNGLLELVPFYLKKVDKHYLSAFPIITPILAVPFFLFVDGTNWIDLAFFSHLSSSFISALAVLAFYILIEHLLPQIALRKKLLITFIYAFCTINFALVSQSLWQHGAVQLFSILGTIYYLKFILNKETLNLLAFGFFGGLSILSRPTAALVFILLGLSLIISKKVTEWIKISLCSLIGLVPSLLFFLWYNATYYQNLSNQGYAGQIFRNWLGNFPLSFFGVWLSPSKGILIYSPVLIFAFFGLFWVLKTTSPQKRTYIIFATIVTIHTLIISFWKHWFGGWSFGYRMSSDVLPFLVALILPWIETPTKTKTWKYFLVAIFFSFLVQLSGLVFFDGIWHAAYDRGFNDTRWLWSIRDSEFSFNLRRILVKFGYLDRACPKCVPGQ